MSPYLSLTGICAPLQLWCCEPKAEAREELRSLPMVLTAILSLSLVLRLSLLLLYCLLHKSLSAPTPHSISQISSKFSPPCSNHQFKSRAPRRFTAARHSYIIGFAQYIATKPIMELCLATGRRLGARLLKWWFEQGDLNLEEIWEMELGWRRKGTYGAGSRGGGGRVVILRIGII